MYVCVYVYVYIYIDHNVWIRGMEQRYGTDPSNRYGTGVWNGDMERVWSRTLFRTFYFDLHPYIYICGRIVQTVPYLCIYHYISIIY